MAALVMLSVAVLLGLLLPSSMAANNILYVGDKLITAGGEALTEGSYTFTMENDCRLVLNNTANVQEVLWSTPTNGLSDCYATMQDNGNLVINDQSGTVVWSSNTPGPKGRYIAVLHRDGYIVIYEPIWTRPDTETSNSKGVVIVKRGHRDTSITAADDDNNILYAGDKLNTSQSLPEENYTLIMQADCNLVLNDNDQEVWSSNTTGQGNNCYALLQTDGNFVIFNDKNEVVWTSNTPGEEDRYIVVVHREGHVIIYKPKWSRPVTNTANSKGAVIVKRGITAADEPRNRKIAMVTNN